MTVIKNILNVFSGATEKTTPVDADYTEFYDSVAPKQPKKVSWANIKATLKTYFDGLYLIFAQDINRYGFLTRTTTTIAFDGTNLFTLADVGAGWSYYRAGVKYTISGNKTVTVASPMVDGTLYYIFIDAINGTLTASTSSWTLNDTKVPVATLYWNNTLTPKYILMDERHTCDMDRATHREHHFVEGTQTGNAGVVSGLTPASDTETNKVFGYVDGQIVDENIFITLSSLTKPNGSTNTYYILYRTSTTTWAYAISDMPFKYGGSNPYTAVEYGDASGNTTAASGPNYVNYYLVQTNAVVNTESNPEISTNAMRFVMVQGRGLYSTLANAQAESFSSFDMTGFPFVEAIAVWQLTFGPCNRGTSVKGRCQYAGIQKVKSNIVSTTAPVLGSHNSLSGLQGGTSAEFYHLTSAQATLLTTPTAPSANQLAVLGLTNGETVLSDKVILGSTTPSTQAFSDSALAGTSLEAAHADHKHAMPSGTTASDIQNASVVYAADAGSTDAYAITLNPAISTYADGQVFFFKANTINTGACTLNVNGKGAITIKKQYNVDLADGDIKAGQRVQVQYDGTNFQMISPLSNAGGGITQVSYDNRNNLRGMSPAEGDLILIDSLGLFRWSSGSTEPDDDETAFATSNGVWLLDCPHWDMIDANNIPDQSDQDDRCEDLESRATNLELNDAILAGRDTSLESRATDLESRATSLESRFTGRILFGSLASAVNSIAANTQLTFAITVAGAAIGDIVCASPPTVMGYPISMYARVTATNTVTIYLNNNSAGTLTFTAGTWVVSIIKSS